MNEKNLELINQEYKKLYISKEYQLGQKILELYYYIKYAKFITLFKVIFQYHKRKKYVYAKDNYHNKELFKKNSNYIIKTFDKDERIAIYTVNIGNYDDIIQPLFISDNVDYYYVSDKKPSNLGIWKWINANLYINDNNLSNVKKARYIKTHPHLLFKNYRYSIFIDCNIRIITDVTKFIGNINKKTKIAAHLHPYRDCIYKEAYSCKYSRRGNYKVIKNQISRYESEGMQKNYGLFETGVLIREHNNKNCIKIMNFWWNEIKNKSERDQLSLTYTLWKNGYSSNDIGIICQSINDNPTIQIIYHKDKH